MQAVRVDEATMRLKFEAWCEEHGLHFPDDSGHWNAFLAGAEAHYEDCEYQDPGNEE